MSKLVKLIIFLVLVGLSIILSTAIMTLKMFYNKKKAGLKQRIKENYINSRHEVNLPKKAEVDLKLEPIKKGEDGRQQYSPSSFPKPLSSASSPSTKAPKPKKKLSTKESNPLHPHEIKLRHYYAAPDSNSPTLISESHLGLALRDIPFEVHDTHHYDEQTTGVSYDTQPGVSGRPTPKYSSVASGSSSGSTSASSKYSSDNSFSDKFGGNAIPADLRYGSIVPNEELESYTAFANDDDILPPEIGTISGGIKRRGVEFVKLENPTMAKDGNINEQKRKQSSKDGGGTGGITTFVKNSILSSLFSSRKSSKKKSSTSTSSPGNHFEYEKERSVLYHLQKASEYGNPHAQNMIANSLASGILPINNDPSIRSKLNLPLNITSDFSSSGNDQLRNAIILWHMSAMEGNIESLMALGYRHYISATSQTKNSQNILVHDYDLKKNEEEIYRHQQDEIIFADIPKRNSGSSPSGHRSAARTGTTPSAGAGAGAPGSTINDENRPSGKNSAVRHSPQESDHYGVLGTCESALVYYEEAVNHIMDELESGPLRGKVLPAQDTHILPEIRHRGSSSALTNNNKPDELDEAIKFMETRASKKHEPDIHSAYKLATMFHYGIRGTKQDMKKALHYYEICANKNSWECAGQAGKFYLFGMGMENDERDLKKALKFFKLGMPGGISNCEERMINKQINTHKDKNDDDDYEGDDDEYEEDGLGDWWEKKIFQCDHPSVNGMGMLYVFGVPGMIKPNLKTAVRHFELANKMGNMDAMYNLAMLKLGWMNPYYDDLFQSDLVNAAKEENEIVLPQTSKGPFTGSFMEASALLTKSADLGHLQAKHRLGMIYSGGFQLAGVLTVRKECKKALSIYKDLATTVGTTVTKRMRAAYKQYMAGDYESSVRNYLAAAETGSIEAQVNAAFLLEEGHCLGMNQLQCMKASVRLWRAAAKMGHEEACLKVGDFYFYGKLREDIDFDDKNSIVAQRDREFSASPLPWTRYILYPEDILYNLRKGSIKFIRSLLQPSTRKSKVCIAEGGNKESVCMNPDAPSKSPMKRRKFSKEQEKHFKIAAKYYRTAAVELQSARANFNLGFMYEWGLGLSQDFPMAKRYYDLASEVARNKGDGALANQIALFFMRLHEHVVKMTKFWLTEEETQQGMESSTDASLLGDFRSSTRMTSGLSTRSGIIIYHILTWESGLILLLTFALVALIQQRNNRRQPRS